MKRLLYFLMLCLVFSISRSQTPVSSASNTQTLNFLVKWTTITGTPYKIGVSSIFDNGNVGIGTNAPAGKLDVNGQVKIRGGVPGAGKILTSDATGLATWQAPVWNTGTGSISTNLWTGIGDLSAESGVTLKISSIYPYPVTANAHDRTILRFTNIYGTQISNTITNWDIQSNTLSFTLKKNLSTWLMMDQNNNVSLGTTSAALVVNSNGNTGIGTAGPDEQLTVSGNIRISDSTIYLRYPGDHYHGLGYYGSARLFGTKVVDGPVLFGFTAGVLGLSYPQKKEILMWDKEYVRIDAKVKALEVTVHTDVWSDYVFSDSYELMPVTELAAYLKEHRHLPEIPAECEITENGIDLGAMQNLQIKKIEELTLYIITMNNEIERLKTQLEEIKTRN